MVVTLGMPGVYKRHAIGVRGQVRKNRGNMFAALAVLLELKRTFHQAANRVCKKTGEPIETFERLTVTLGQGRFVIPSIHLAGTSVRKYPYDRLRLRRKVRVPGRKCTLACQALLLEQTPQTKRTHTHPAPLQHRPASQFLNFSNFVH